MTIFPKSPFNGTASGDRYGMPSNQSKPSRDTTATYKFNRELVQPLKQIQRKTSAAWQAVATASRDAFVAVGAGVGLRTANPNISPVRKQSATQSSISKGFESVEIVAPQVVQTGVVPQPLDLEPHFAENIFLKEFFSKGSAKISPNVRGDTWLNPEPKDFMMRRIPMVGYSDTICGNSTLGIQSEHGFGRSYADADIKLVHRPENVVRQKNLCLGVNEKKKHILLQKGTRGCSAAVTAMLIADHGGEIDVEKVEQCNLGTSDDRKRDLEAAGLTPVETTVTSWAHSKKRAQKIRDLLQTHGPAIISVDSGIGNHVVILDEISPDLKWVRIRDPYHGWDITISRKALFASGSCGKLLHAANKQSADTAS